MGGMDSAWGSFGKEAFRDGVEPYLSKNLMDVQGGEGFQIGQNWY